MNKTELKKQFIADFNEAMKKLVDKYDGAEGISILAIGTHVDEETFECQSALCILGTSDDLIESALCLISEKDTKPFFVEAMIFDINKDKIKTNVTIN